MRETFTDRKQSEAQAENEKRESENDEERPEKQRYEPGDRLSDHENLKYGDNQDNWQQIAQAE